MKEQEANGQQLGTSGSKRSKQEVGTSNSEEGESLTSEETEEGVALKEPKGISPVFLQPLRDHILFFSLLITGLTHLASSFPRSTSDGARDNSISQESRFLSPLGPPVSPGHTQGLSGVQE